MCLQTPSSACPHTLTHTQPSGRRDRRRCWTVGRLPVRRWRLLLRAALRGRRLVESRKQRRGIRRRSPVAHRRRRRKRRNGERSKRQKISVRRETTTTSMLHHSKWLLLLLLCRPKLPRERLSSSWVLLIWRYRISLQKSGSFRRRRGRHFQLHTRTRKTHIDSLKKQCERSIDWSRPCWWERRKKKGKSRDRRPKLQKCRWTRVSNNFPVALQIFRVAADQNDVAGTTGRLGFFPCLNQFLTHSLIESVDFLFALAWLKNY